MAAVSASSRLEGKKGADVKIKTLTDETTTSALKTLHTLVRTSFGPNGKLKLLHNNSGGSSILTSSSSRLFSALSVSNPVIRLLTTAIQGHIQKFSDGGLFTALLSLNIIQNSFVLDIPRRLLMDIYELLLQHTIDYLGSVPCSIKRMIDVGNLKHLNSLVHCVLSTKPCCGLSENDLEHICGLIVRAFLRTFQGCSAQSSTSAYGIVNRLAIEGKSPSESQLMDGVLFSAPQIPTYRERPFDCPRLADGSIRVAVFAISLAGDSEDLQADVTFDITADDDDQADIGAAVLHTLENLVDGLIDAGVGLVFCQRVVHPTIKQRLRTSGLMVIDRLGSSHITPVKVLTGAILLASLHTPLSDCVFGQLDAVQHAVLGGRSYLHLLKHGSSVCTLVTCQRMESASEELKHMCTMCHDMLYSTLVNPAVLAGGGCWQVHLAATLRTLLVKNRSDWCSTLGCRQLQLSQGGNAFCLALEQVAIATGGEQHMADRINQHHFMPSRKGFINSSEKVIRCGCGQNVSDENTQFYDIGYQNTNIPNCQSSFGAPNESVGMFEVLDLFDVSENALKTAVAAANMVLGIEHYIHDIN